MTYKVLWITMQNAGLLNKAKMKLLSGTTAITQRLAQSQQKINRT